MGHRERHRAGRTSWLRAGVMGANDGLVSTASLVVGVAAAHASSHDILVAGIAGLTAGAMSMAAGEYVSVSSQSDTERADIERERHELATDREHEHAELAAIYVARGLDPALAEQVAVQLMAHDALGAHVRDELGISETLSAKPVQAALASAGAFAVGASLPLLVVVTVPGTPSASRGQRNVPGIPRTPGRCCCARRGCRCHHRCHSCRLLGRPRHGSDCWRGDSDRSGGLSLMVPDSFSRSGRGALRNGGLEGGTLLPTTRRPWGRSTVAPTLRQTDRTFEPMSRLPALQRALASNEPLTQIRSLIPDDGTNEQEVVVSAFACIQETRSSGMSILFDRFDDDELEKIDHSLECIGAERPLAEFRKLAEAFQRAIANDEDRQDAAERLVAEADSQRIDRASEALVQEMEEKLLAYCQRNVEALAAE